VLFDFGQALEDEFLIPWRRYIEGALFEPIGRPGDDKKEGLAVLEELFVGLAVAVSGFSADAVLKGDFELVEILVGEVAPVEAGEFVFGDMLNISVVRELLYYINEAFAFAHDRDVLEVFWLRGDAVDAAAHDIEDEVPFLMGKALVGAVITEGLAVEEVTGLVVRLLDAVA